MTQDETLTAIRRIVARMLEPDSQHLDTADAVILAELVQTLDNTATRHGWLPAPWKAVRWRDE